jgi:hypothetical protein
MISQLEAIDGTECPQQYIRMLGWREVTGQDTSRSAGRRHN